MNINLIKTDQYGENINMIKTSNFPISEPNNRSIFDKINNLIPDLSENTFLYIVAFFGLGYILRRI